MAEILLLIVIVGVVIWSVRRAKGKSPFQPPIYVRPKPTQKTPSPPPALTSEPAVAQEVYNDLDHELRSLRNKVKRGEMPFADFKERLDEAEDDVKVKIDDLRFDKKHELIDADDYDEQMEALKFDRESVRDMLSELPELEQWDTEEAADPRWTPGQKGKWSQFDYIDNDGNPSLRKVTMWESRGRYVVGYDKDRKEERTFRKARISNWQAG
jgi:hypothetical protein